MTSPDRGRAVYGGIHITEKTGVEEAEEIKMNLKSVMSMYLLSTAKENQSELLPMLS